MSPKPNTKQSGFTLLEILIALFIFTIIAMIMTHALHSSIETEAHMEKNAERMREAQMTLLFLSHDLEQVLNRPATVNDQPENSLIGSEAHLQFTHGGFSNPLSRSLHSSLQRTEYGIAKNHLLRTTWDALDRTQTTGSQQRALLRIDTVEFAYLDDKGQFVKNWPPSNDANQTPLPRAISVILTIKGWGKLKQLYVLPGGYTDAPLPP